MTPEERAELCLLGGGITDKGRDLGEEALEEALEEAEEIEVEDP